MCGLDRCVGVKELLVSLIREPTNESTWTFAAASLGASISRAAEFRKMLFSARDAAVYGWPARWRRNA